MQVAILEQAAAEAAREEGADVTRITRDRIVVAGAVLAGLIVVADWTQPRPVALLIIGVGFTLLLLWHWAG